MVRSEMDAELLYPDSPGEARMTRSNKTRYLRVRVTDDEYGSLIAEAHKRDISISQLVRESMRFRRVLDRTGELLNSGEITDEPPQVSRSGTHSEPPD